MRPSLWTVCSSVKHTDCSHVYFLYTNFILDKLSLLVAVCCKHCELRTLPTYLGWALWGHKVGNCPEIPSPRGPSGIQSIRLLTQCPRSPEKQNFQLFSCPYDADTIVLLRPQDAQIEIYGRTGSILAILQDKGYLRTVAYKTMGSHTGCQVPGECRVMTSLHRTTCTMMLFSQKRPQHIHSFQDWGKVSIAFTIFWKKEGALFLRMGHHNAMRGHYFLRVGTILQGCTISTEETLYFKEEALVLKEGALFFKEGALLTRNGPLLSRRGGTIIFDIFRSG